MVKQKTLEEVIAEIYDVNYDKSTLIEMLREGFIFGKYAEGTHYQKEYILEKINEYELTLNPVEETNPIE